jgi:serine/threonine-protein kinase
MNPTSPTGGGGPLAAPPPPSLVGETLDGRYRITRKLGEGGMGEVYAAEHVHIEKKFAIKLLRQEIVSNPEAVSRFRQEARSSSSIGHRNIIAIEDFGTLSDGRIYMCMELLNGAALNDLITTPQPTDRLLNILIQTGHGLAAAHAKGIVHRDMKPENIFVTIGPNNEDIPKLLDFGIAKVAGNDGNNNLTKTGTIFGTPFYMAPEQALGNTVDARTDIYAMGVIMYEVFAGSLPFQGESFMGILTQHITTQPEPVAQRAAKAGRQLPPGLAEVITRCMLKDPNQRYSTMDELVGELVNIYRSVAGAGMSTYMEAFKVAPGSASRTAVPGPLPTGSSPVAATVHVTPGAMPQVQHPTGPATGPVPVGPSGPNLAIPHQTGGLYDAGASVVPIPKKSKTGLIIAIIAILAIGGGVAAFVIVSQNNKGDGPGSGSQVADNKGSDGSDTKGSDNKGSDNKGSDAHAGGSGKGSDDHKGSNTNDTPPSQDAGVATVADAAVETPVDAAVPDVPPIKVKVTLKNPPGVFEAFEDGKKIFDGPDFIDIQKGTPRTITLKVRGYKPKTITIDGSETVIREKLERERVVIGPGSGSAGSGSAKPPDRVDCSRSLAVPMRDPRFPACRAQYCRLNPKDARCDAE